MKMAPYQGGKTCFKRMKEEREQAQPQLYGTYYLLVRIALTGQVDHYSQHYKCDRRNNYVPHDVELIAMLSQIKQRHRHADCHVHDEQRDRENSSYQREGCCRTVDQA